MQETNARHWNQVHFTVKSTLDTIPTKISIHNDHPRLGWLTTQCNSRWKKSTIHNFTTAWTGMKNASIWCAYQEKLARVFWDMATLTCLFWEPWKTKIRFHSFWPHRLRICCYFFDQGSYSISKFPNFCKYGNPENLNLLFCFNFP